MAQGKMNAIRMILNNYGKIYSTDSVLYNGHTYYLVPSNMTWSDAKRYCEEHGGHLATITSEKENQIVKNLVAGSDISYVWLGATDSLNENTWIWVTNEEWKYTNWNSGQPDNDCNPLPENYLGMYKNPLGFWNDFANSYQSLILEVEG